MLKNSEFPFEGSGLEGSGMHSNALNHTRHQPFIAYLTHDMSPPQVGAHAILHACSIANGAVIGVGAQVLDGAKIGANSIIEAGSLVSPGTTVPSNEVCRSLFLTPTWHSHISQMKLFLLTLFFFRLWYDSGMTDRLIRTFLQGLGRRPGQDDSKSFG